MRRIGRLLACGVCIGLMLCACAKAPEPPGSNAQTLGDTPDGAPIANSGSDIGILQDPADYKPASFGGRARTGNSPDAEPAAVVAGEDATSGARRLIDNLLNDLESGEVDLVLGAVAAEQIQPLLDDHDFLFVTQEAYEELTEMLVDTAGEPALAQLHADLRKLMTDPLKIDVVNDTTVTASPNPLIMIFGPTLSPATLTMKPIDGDWKIRPEAALTTENVAAIGTYHEALQEALYEIADALEDEEIQGPQAVYAALLKAVAGQELDLSGTGTDEPVIDSTTVEPTP